MKTEDISKFLDTLIEMRSEIEEQEWLDPIDRERYSALTYAIDVIETLHFI